MAAINQPGSSFLKPAALSSSDGNKKVEEYTIRVPKDKKKTYGMMKLSSGADVDFLKLGQFLINMDFALCDKNFDQLQNQTTVKMERENNLKEYKTANDLENAPKFGAGSEFGREQKEEARRKKYGIIRKKYNPDDQPWIMKIGSGKQARRYKGTREGTITDNTSYYIFTKSADGAFEAFPVDEWYNFTPMIRYKYLNSEEAEEEFKRRDHTLNLFSVMVRKRIKNDNSNEEGEEVEKKEKSKGKKSKSFLLTDMDEFGDLSDEDDEEEEDGEGEGDDEEKPKKAAKGKKGKGVEKRKKNAKHNSDDEAVEDSDEGDFDDREVDYMSDSSSSMSELEDRDKLDKYEEKGVDEEAGLKKLIDSEASSDEEEDKNKEEEGEQDDGSKVKPDKVKKEGSESSSSSSSDSDSDIEKEEKFSSVLFMQKKSSSRSATPTSFETEDKKAGTKRKPESETTASVSLPPSSKKVRTESPITVGSGASEGITEEAIRRYLMRKPMTAKELVQKFKSKKLHMTKEEIIGKILQLLKKIKPDKKNVNDKLYLSLPKTD